MSINLRVKDVCNKITIEAPVVRENDDLNYLITTLVKNPIARTLYVVDNSGKLVGVIPVLYLLKICGYVNYGIIQPGIFLAKNVFILTGKKAKDIMLDPITVTEETSVSEAIKLMLQFEVQEIPVVDENQNVIGDLNSIEILAASFDFKHSG
ncbi:hypothetical protein AT15_07215 [Kosmotoga arenicorallina S304]|uniref:CBS domain-containing protein n=1 Tax=Kosmotoga arenicorallina S304 TaxID=1453497 RepID=A0A176K2I4_9BACT|nr:CBS domain-containing protein [Kosmotoga arenicorallina]OAA31278.1 hypothetical protein AT15_07215 [Kosmotoga arenicorallina S304]